jgi:uncharacterized membrane protein YbhN (UPF0104 family)
MKIGRSKTLARWVSWIFGLALLACVVMFAAHYRQEKALAQLLRQARPVWLLVGLLLQMGTYTTDARIWQRVLSRANISRPLRSYVGLGLAKLFMDQAVPSVGLSGTLLVIRSLDRRDVPRGASMAAVVLDLVGYYAAYVLALGIALAIVWVRRELTPLMALPAGIFTAVAGAVPVALLWVNRGRTLPGWLKKLPFVKTALQALTEATPATVHDVLLIIQCTALHLAIHALDAGTLWVMLRALGFEANPAPVFASFMLSTLAQTLGVSPGGLGVFEAVSVAMLRLIGVPVTAGLEATLLFRFFTFWLPMAPGLILARREARA